MLTELAARTVITAVAPAFYFLVYAKAHPVVLTAIKALLKVVVH